MEVYTQVSHHKCAPPSCSPLGPSSIRWMMNDIDTSTAFHLTRETVLIRWSIPANTPGTVKHSYWALLVWLSVRGDSNFPDGGHRWGHVILGKLEWGCRFFCDTSPADQAFAGPSFAFIKIIHNSDVIILTQYTVHTHYNHVVQAAVTVK